MHIDVDTSCCVHLCKYSILCLYIVIFLRLFKLRTGKKHLRTCTLVKCLPSNYRAWGQSPHYLIFYANFKCKNKR